MQNCPEIVKGADRGSGLVSLVSVSGRNWTQTAEIGEAVEIGEIIEMANIHAVFMHVAEKMVGWQKRLGEYPTLSATSFILLCSQTLASG